MSKTVSRPRYIIEISVPLTIVLPFFVIGTNFWVTPPNFFESLIGLIFHWIPVALGLGMVVVLARYYREIGWLSRSLLVLLALLNMWPIALDVWPFIWAIIQG